MGGQGLFASTVQLGRAHRRGLICGSPVQRRRLKGRMALGGQHRRLYVWTAREPNTAAPSQECTMTTVGDVMHTGATYVGQRKTLTAAAQHLGDLGAGRLPICRDYARLHEMTTDRDIVSKCIAAGHDPNITTAGELAKASTYHVDCRGKHRATCHRQSPPSGHHRRSRHRPPPSRTRNRSIRQSDLRPHSHHQPPTLDNLASKS